MSAISNVAPIAGRRGNFVLLRADALRLILPQREVGEASYRERLPAATEEQGVFALASPQGLVAALSEDMTLATAFPAERFVLTRLSGVGSELAWAWSEIRILVDVELRPRPLPPALLAPGMPVDAFIEDADGIAFPCSAQRLAEYAFAHHA